MFVAGNISQNNNAVEETVRRIMSQRGVLGVIIANLDGIVIRTTMDAATTQLYVGTLHPLLISAKETLKDMEPVSPASETASEDKELRTLRIYTKKNKEIIITLDKENFMIAIQDMSKPGT